MSNFDRNTPVLFLIFNRPETTELVFEAIKKVKPKKLFIAADGPRNEEDVKLCELTRSKVKDINWDCELITLFRENNLGCKRAVSEAITWFFKSEEMGIVLEDDCLPSNSFFDFCSHLLQKYKNDERIGHIGGTNFQNQILRGKGSYYYSRLTHVWGWASWRRVWEKYDVNMQSFAGFDISLFDNIPSHEPYKEIWYENFRRTFNNEIDTWDFQYSYSNLINNYLSIIPNKNLISNIGFGPTATHTTGTGSFSILPLCELEEIQPPDYMIADTSADLYTQYYEYGLDKIKKKSFLSRTWKKIKTGLKKSA